VVIELFWFDGDEVFSARATKNPLARKAIKG